MIDYKRIEEYLNNCNCKTQAIAKKIPNENIFNDIIDIANEELVNFCILIYKYYDKKYLDIYYDKMFNKNACFRIKEKCHNCNKEIEYLFKAPEIYKIRNLCESENKEYYFKEIISWGFRPILHGGTGDYSDFIELNVANSKDNYIIDNQFYCGECAREITKNEIINFKNDFIDNQAYCEFDITYDKKQKDFLNKKFTEFARKIYKDNTTYDIESVKWLYGNYNYNKDLYDLYKLIDKFLKKYYEKDKEFYIEYLTPKIDKAIQNAINFGQATIQ